MFTLEVGMEIRTITLALPYIQAVQLLVHFIYFIKSIVPIEGCEGPLGFVCQVTTNGQSMGMDPMMGGDYDGNYDGYPGYGDEYFQPSK